MKDELSLAEYEKIATSLGPMLQVTLTGGSPELRADLPEIAEIYSRICRPANITFVCSDLAPAELLTRWKNSNAYAASAFYRCYFA